MNKLCIGCDVIDNCSLKQYAKYYACPCFECLIKMMCTKYCSDFDAFEDGYIDDLIEEYEDYP